MYTYWPITGSYINAPAERVSCKPQFSSYLRDSQTAEVIISCIVLIQHGSGDIRYITTSIAFAGNVNLEVFDAKSRFEIFEEFEEILGDIFFGSGSDFSNREASPNGLLNPVSDVN